MAQHANTDERKAAFLEALEVSLGVITDACKVSGIPRRTVYEWKRDDPEFAAGMKEADEIALDFVESAQFKGIREGNPSLIIWYLKTRGKKRGYIERQELAIDINKLSDQEVDALLDRALELAKSKEDE